MSTAATDAGLTSYHAIMAVAAAKVYGAEVNPEARKLAGEIGLSGVADSIEAFKDKDKDLDLIVDHAGFGTTTSAATETPAECGTLVQVAMGRLEATINTCPCPGRVC